MDKSTSHLPGAATNQQGMALVLSMIILTVMTMLGITLMQTSNLEEKMSSNTQQLNVAFQAAETALRAGEKWIDSQNLAPFTNDCSSDCGLNDTVWPAPTATSFLNNVDDENASFWTEHGRLDPALALPRIPTQPLRVIQETDFVPDSLTVGIGAPTGITYYRITSQATGGTGVEDVRLQSTFVKRFN